MAIPTSHAEEDTSSILVELTPLETATPSLMPNIEIHSEELSPITSPMTTPTLVTETPQVMPNIAATPMINMAANQSPLTSAQIMMAQSAPSSNIFDSIMSQAPAVAEVAPVMPESIGQETLTPIAGSPTEDLLSPKQAPTDQTASVYTASFATPRAFIEQSIANIDVMLGNIDRRHDAKAAEEESYKIEKLRYTELEHTAHNEKIIMDKERDHALHMKQILESERQRDENNRALKDTPNASVTSTLAGIGEEHAFSHKHSHKKSEARQNEEELLVAS